MKQTSIIAFIIAGIAAAACGSNASVSEQSSYSTMRVSRESRTINSEHSARIEGRQVVEIRPQVSGTITEIRIGEGQKVRKGQVLFIIDQVPYKAALEVASANVKTAEASLATARLKLESTRMLHEKKVVEDYVLRTAENEAASAEAAAALAAAQEINARNNLSYTEVKSPVDGVAGMIAYRTGALVGSGITEPLVTVSDDRLIYAYFSMTESKVLDLVENYGSVEEFLKQMPGVELKMSNGKTYSRKGRISAVSGIVTPGTGAVMLRADFQNTEGLLMDGGTGSVIIPSKIDSCIVIPKGATFELQDKVFAYKVVDGKAKSFPITVSKLENGTEYIVEEGLEEGDIIIAEGAGLVNEGASVNIE